MSKKYGFLWTGPEGTHPTPYVHIYLDTNGREVEVDSINCSPTGLTEMNSHWKFKCEVTTFVRRVYVPGRDEGGLYKMLEESNRLMRTAPRPWGRRGP